MGKIATGFRKLDELKDWNGSGFVHFTYNDMKYVWVLASVDVRRNTKDGEEIEAVVLPCRKFSGHSNLVIPDIYGAYRDYVITGWKPMPSVLTEAGI